MRISNLCFHAYIEQAARFFQRICCIFMIRLLNPSFTVDSTNAVELFSPQKSRTQKLLLGSIATEG
jgi:hypothetical protein